MASVIIDLGFLISDKLPVVGLATMCCLGVGLVLNHSRQILTVELHMHHHC